MTNTLTRKVTPMPTRTPAPHTSSLAVVEGFFDALHDHDLDAISPLLAEDVIEVTPYSPAGTPDPWYVFDGKEAVMGYMRMITENFSQNRLTDVVAFEAADGETVFVEAKGDLIVRTTGRPYRNVYIFKFVVRDQTIVRISEYANPVPIAELLGAPLGSSRGAS